MELILLLHCIVCIKWGGGFKEEEFTFVFILKNAAC